MSHANARFTPAGRLLIVQRVEGGMPQDHVAGQMGLSLATVAKWWHRWVEHGEAGLVDRSSRPHRSPRRRRSVPPRCSGWPSRWARWSRLSSSPPP
jgi:hypothetical protein